MNKYQLVLIYQKDTHNRHTVQLPSNVNINATKTGNIPLSQNLILHAKSSHIFDGLHNASFISLGHLCDDECIAILDKNEINILKYSKLILKLHRNQSYGLWDIPISKPLGHRAHAIITRDKTNTDLIQYLRVCCFSLMPRIFLMAIKNVKFLTWTGLKN